MRDHYAPDESQVNPGTPGDTTNHFTQPLHRVYIESLGHSVYITDDCHRMLKARGECVTVELDYECPPDESKLKAGQQAMLMHLRSADQLRTAAQISKAIRPYIDNQEVTAKTVGRWAKLLHSFGVRPKGNQGYQYDEDQDRSIN